MKFWNFKAGEKNEEVELRISGEIIDADSAWLYEWFGIPAASPNAFRKELKKHTGKNLTVWIDSWGGDVTAGAGIYNALKEHKGKVTVKIDGKAVSAASVIAMAGDDIQMSPVGLMMIHNPWTGVAGDAAELRHIAGVLDIVKDTIINAYQLKTKKSRTDIAAMMDGETWMSAQKAKDEGFIDNILYVEGDIEIISAKNSFIFNRATLQNNVLSSVRNFVAQQKIEQNEEMSEVPINNIDDLKNEKPDLVNQLVQEAVKAERDRFSALDALNVLDNPVICDLVDDAKKTGKTVEEIQPFVNILKKHTENIATATENNAGQQFFNALVSDNKESGADNAKATGNGRQTDNAQNDAAAINFIAGVINKKNGRLTK